MGGVVGDTGDDNTVAVAGDEVRVVNNNQQRRIRSTSHPGGIDLDYGKGVSLLLSLDRPRRKEENGNRQEHIFLSDHGRSFFEFAR